MVRNLGRNFIEALLRPINPAFTSILGVLGICWGLWVLAPWWNVFDTAPVYRAAHLSEEVWGSVSVMVGAIVLYGALRPAFHSLVIGSALAATFWFWASLVLLIGDWRNTGWVTYLFVSLYGTMVYLNVRVNHANGHDWSGRD